MYVDGMNDYGYALNNPANITDIFGLACDIDDENPCNQHPVICFILGQEPHIGPIVSGVATAGSMENKDVIGTLSNAFGVGLGVAGWAGAIEFWPGLIIGVGVTGVFEGIKWVGNWIEDNIIYGKRPVEGVDYFMYDDIHGESVDQIMNKMPIPWY